MENQKEKFIPLIYQKPSEAGILDKAQHFRDTMEARRSVRFFSDEQVPKQVIENIIMTASSAPSGAHKQPWTFCAVSDKSLKSQIRIAAEKEEYDNYHGRMSEDWLKDLEVFETDWHKEFLDTAPWLIIVFKKAYNVDNDHKSKNYYVNESVGIACGFLISAIHMAGLVTLTHTPSPMNFLQNILNRPDNERPFLLLPVGFPAENVSVPNIIRKTSDEAIIYFENHDIPYNL
jgi:iodotyrosine deiodinase